jgi:hypothetical protein
MSILDFFFPREVTRDQLGHLGGNPRFRPPAPSVSAGHVDRQGVMVTKEDWAEYERGRGYD